jgi:DNA-binding SARP family transcriptional activator/LysM repeat protein
LLLIGSPIVLAAVVGAPSVPDFRGSDGISGSFVPVEAVLRLLGILSWGLWAYLAFAVLLHGAATVAALRGARGQRTLLAASSVLTPKVVRSLVEIAIGGTLVAASLSVHVSSAVPALRAPVEFETEPARPTAHESIHSKPIAPTRNTYRVRRGDSLWRIAERKLGSGFKWRVIYQLNEGRRFHDGRSLTDPRLIYPGWVLELPDVHQPSEHPADLDEDGPFSTEAHPAPTSPSPTASPSPVRVSDRSPEPIQEDADSEPETDDADTLAPAGPALQIPSGLLVAASFASGLLTAHLLGRLHRRRSRRLSGASSVEPVDTPELIHDLRRAGASEMASPVDVAIDSVIEAWRAHAGSWPHVLGAIEAGRHVSVLLRASEGALPTDSGGTISPRIRFVRAGSTVVAELASPFPVQVRQPQTSLERGLLVALGRAPDGSAVHASATGLGAMSIAGTEAAGLMRQLVLCAATLSGPDDLRLMLLGPSDRVRSLSRLPQTFICRDWERAPETLRELELEFVRRARLFLQEGAQDIRDHLAEHSDERLPAILVVCEEPPSALAGTIEALARQASALGAAVLALGWRLPGAELHARAGQTVELETDIPLPRPLEPFKLGEDAMGEAIDIIREAYPTDAASESEGAEAAKDPEASAPMPVQVSVQDAAPRLVQELERPLPPPEEPLMPPEDMIAIRCLGPFEISRRGEPMPTGWSVKGRELVAYLVARPAGAPRDRVIEELWPDVEPTLAKLRFNKAATLVRSTARGTQDSRVYVERVGDSAYRLEEHTWWIDAWEFERLIREAERTEDAIEAIGRLRDAVALYRGEFCDDAYYPWLEGVRERFRNLFVEACGRLSYLLSTAGEHDQALSVLERAIQADPVCEDLVRRAIAVEAALGRRAAALARYRRLETTLDAELDIEPDPETRELIDRLLRPSERAG